MDAPALAAVLLLLVPLVVALLCVRVGWLLSSGAVSAPCRRTGDTRPLRTMIVLGSGALSSLGSVALVRLGLDEQPVRIRCEANLNTHTPLEQVPCVFMTRIPSGRRARPPHATASWVGVGEHS